MREADSTRDPSRLGAKLTLGSRRGVGVGRTRRDRGWFKRFDGNPFAFAWNQKVMPHQVRGFAFVPLRVIGVDGHSYRVVGVRGGCSLIGGFDEILRDSTRESRQDVEMLVHWIADPTHAATP